jgi:hypothetical protein
MAEEWTTEDETTFRPLKRKYDRIHKKNCRDKTRVRKFTHHKTVNKNELP